MTNVDNFLRLFGRVTAGVALLACSWWISQADPILFAIGTLSVFNSLQTLLTDHLEIKEKS